jgi:uncharacterized membrane-anchored protein
MHSIAMRILLLLSILSSVTLCHAAEHRLIPVCIHAHYRACGLIDGDGNVVVTPKYSAIYENDRYWTVERESGFKGLLDADGRELIAPRFDHIGRFVNGIAPATLPGPRNTLNGYIDTQGKWLIEPKFLYSTEFNGTTALVWLGPTYETRKLVLLQRDGTFKPMPYTDVMSTLDGRYIVWTGGESESSAAGRQYTGLDQRGRVLIQLQPNESLKIVNGGGWIVIRNSEDAPPKNKSASILNVKGKELFRVTGKDPWIRDPRDTLTERPEHTSFTADGESEGIVNIMTGAVTLQPGKVEVGLISQNRVSFAARNGDETRYGYRDLKGDIVIPAKYEYSNEFAHGYASASIPASIKLERENDLVVESDGSNVQRTLVIDLNGKEVAAFAKLKPTRIDLAPWSEDLQSPVRRDIARVESGNRAYFTTLYGKVIATLTTQAIEHCEAHILYNARGEIIWPNHAKNRERDSARISCAARERDTTLPEVAVAYSERIRFEAEIQSERASIDEQGGGLLNLVDPERAERLAKARAAPWQSDGEISLGDVATLQLPDGYRFLPPADAVALLNEIEPDRTHRDDVALLAAPDNRWRANVRVIESRHVSLSDGLSDPSSILSTLHNRHFGLFADKSAHDDGVRYHFSWEFPPTVDAAKQRMDYGLTLRDFSTADTLRTVSAVRFGREHSIMVMAYFGGVLQTHHPQFFRDEIIAIADAIEFRDGERYEDPRRDSQTAHWNLESFISGFPTEKEQQFGAAVRHQIQAAEERKSALRLDLLGLVFVVVLAFIVGLSKQRKA